MERTFKAKWNQFLIEIVGVFGAGIALVVWKGVAVTWVFVLLLAGYLVYRLVLNGAVIKRVTIRPDGLEVVPVLPWFKPRRWQSAELATYKSVALKGRLKSRPFMGIIAPKEGKHEIIWGSGTDEFSALDEVLSSLLPSPQESEHVEHAREIRP